MKLLPNGDIVLDKKDQENLELILEDQAEYEEYAMNPLPEEDAEKIGDFRDQFNELRNA